MRTRITLTGDKQIDKILEQMPKELSEKTMLSAHKANAKLLLNAAKQLVPQKEGDVQDSLAIVTEKKGLEKGTVYVGPRKNKPWEGWKAPFLEFGTTSHTIELKRGEKKSLSDGRTFFGKSIRHPGTPAQPFMRPAFDLTIKPMLEGIRTDLAKAVRRVMRKYIKNTK